MQMNMLLREKRMEQLIDRRCCRDADAASVEAMIDVAARCTDGNPDERPSMKQVLQMLEQEIAMSPSSSDSYESHSDQS